MHLLHTSTQYPMYYGPSPKHDVRWVSRNSNVQNSEHFERSTASKDFGVWAEDEESASRPVATSRPQATRYRAAALSWFGASSMTAFDPVAAFRRSPNRTSANFSGRPTAALRRSHGQRSFDGTVDPIAVVRRTVLQGCITSNADATSTRPLSCGCDGCLL